MPTYAIGDIQGCYRHLQTLLTAINFNPNYDQLWFAGDLVNRGPDSLQTLRFIKNLARPPVIVLGNHDLHLLAVVYANAPLNQKDTLTDIMHAPDCEALCQWLRQQKMLHHDPALGYAMVHAGIPPQWDLAAAQEHAHEVEQALRAENYVEFLKNLYGNSPASWHPQLKGWERLRYITNSLTRMRFCDEDGRLELTIKGGANKAPNGYGPWFTAAHRRNQNTPILFGHWSALQGQTDAKNVYPLDEGCIWGGCLAAMRLDDGKRFSIPCNKTN